MAKPHAALRAFGLQLRQAREFAGLTNRDLAELLTWAPSKISKLEMGHQTATAQDVRDWAAATHLDAGKLAHLLAELERVRLEYTAWRQQLADGTGAKQAARLRAESDVTSIRAFEPAVIPGLLQTAEYARSILSGFVDTYQVVNDVDEGVRVRIRRQESLYRPGKAFHFVVAEAALYTRMAPASVMVGQLDRLLAVAGLPSVTLGVIPFSATYVVGPLNGFWIFDDNYVLVETFSAELTITEAAEVALHVRIFERLSDSAVYDGDARQLITLAAAGYQSAMA